MSTVGSVMYLSLGAAANAFLGIIFTISTTPFYSGYANPKDKLGALSLIRDTWRFVFSLILSLNGILFCHI